MNGYARVLIAALALWHCGLPVIAQDAPPPVATPSPAVAPSPPPPAHIENLNKAFILTPEQVTQAYEKGAMLARKGVSVRDVFKDETQLPRGVKGEKGRSHESRVYFLSINGIASVHDAYRAANNYEPLPKADGRVIYQSAAVFNVQLQSVPKVALNRFQRDRAADSADVNVTKFVLTDDKGNVLGSISAEAIGGVKSGDMNFSGVSRQTHIDTTQSNAYAYDTHGNSANAYGTATTTRAEYIPWSETHPYYSASYVVPFPLFDDQGQPIIKSDVKSVTLHIITENGEKVATYKLEPPKL